MKKMKFIGKDKKLDFCLLDGELYKAYTIGNIPVRFGFIYDKINEVEGIYQWFNYKGFSYLPYDKEKYLKL